MLPDLTRIRAWRLVAMPLLLCTTAACADRADGPGVGAAGEAVAAAEPPRPMTTGLDSALLAEVAARGEALPRLRTLIVARHGRAELERHYRGPGLDAPANVKSVSKSILSALVGIAIGNGHLDGVDQPVSPFFARYIPAGADSAIRRITVGNLLTMQSGLQGTSGSNYGRWVTSPNWVRYAVTRPMEAEPGTVRRYSTGNSHLLSAVLTQATGTSTWAYARERLAAPLGISLPRWPADPQGIYFGGNDMRVSPRDLLRFGEMYRNGGRHEGRQVVPAEWVQASLVPHTRARRSSEGYGYGWFIGQVRGWPMFYAWGYGGQFIFIVPDLELTMVTTSDPDVAREGEHLRAVRSLLGELVVPAAEAGAARRSVTEPT